MRLVIHDIDGVKISELADDDFQIKNVQDALDLMVESDEQGARKIIVKEKNISPEFFDLKTGLAGEIVQKFSTYDMCLAIVGDFSKFTSKSLRDFIYESNRTGRIIFVATVVEALEKFTRK
jgi:hypothetical protein